MKHHITGVPIEWDECAKDYEGGGSPKTGWVLYNPDTEMFLQGDSWVSGFSLQLFQMDENDVINPSQSSATTVALIRAASELLWVHCIHYEVLVTTETLQDGGLVSSHVMKVYQELDFMDIIVAKSRHGTWANVYGRCP